MQQDKRRLLKSVYEICFSVLTAIVGLLFIVQVWSIFRSAPKKAYTAERISTHFKQIVVPVIFWFFAWIGNILLGYVYPDKKEKAKAYFGDDKRLYRLKNRLPQESAAFRAGKLEIVRWILQGAAALFGIAAAIVCLVYIFDENYSSVLQTQFFTEQYGVADRMLRVMIWACGAIMFFAAVAVFSTYVSKKQEEKVKKELAENALKKKRGETLYEELSEEEIEKNKKARACAAKREELVEKVKTVKCSRIFSSEKFIWGVRAALGILGIVFVITGIVNGGMSSVLAKAVRICTQCIGLG
ncbi:MAG: hypothetical protein IJV83_01485 [Clostridia bacterium]|nr:hypothetical protein [Clostridia bacterium]